MAFASTSSWIWTQFYRTQLTFSVALICMSDSEVSLARLVWLHSMCAFAFLFQKLSSKHRRQYSTERIVQ